MVDEILNGVYDITVKETDGRRGRVYLVDDDVPTLFDTGYEDTPDALFEGVDAVGVEPERLIVTHGDPDHIGGFDAVVERYAPETWVPRETEYAGDVDPDHRYVDGDHIGSFEAVHAPGHEADNYALVNADDRYVIPGDAVFGADLRGFPPGYLIAPPALYSESVDQAEASMEKLLEYEFDSVLVFHGSAVLDVGKERLDAFINFPGKPDWAEYVR